MHLSEPIIAFLSAETTHLKALSIPPSVLAEPSAASNFTASVWLSLRLCFISTCLVIDRHGVSVHTALPTTDFLGRRECLQHREHSILVPSSTESIQGKSSFHSGSIPICLVFDRGLSVLEDDLRFTIFFLLVSARGRSRARASALVISAWPRPLPLYFARANMNSTAKKKAYRPMCLPNGRHIGPIRLSMPGENTGACLIHT